MYQKVKFKETLCELLAYSLHFPNFRVILELYAKNKTPKGGDKWISVDEVPGQRTQFPCAACLGTFSGGEMNLPF